MENISKINSATVTGTDKSKNIKYSKPALPAKNVSPYKYTDKDLGEGILNKGITPSYAASLRNFTLA